ncbi:cobalt-precorrin-7 (C(5))-methyltransferase [Methanogenium cariaci]
MIVVGVGCGPGMLTEQAVAAIREADVIYGSDRAIVRAAAHIRSTCAVHVITDYQALRNLPEHAVVLSTGDPMLAGLGYLGGEVISGISSYQYACAKLGVAMTTTAIVNAHARDHEQAVREICFEIARGKIVFVIADPGFVPSVLADHLRAKGSACRIAICEKLGYPDETISVGDTETPPVPQSDLFVLMAGRF